MRALHIERLGTVPYGPALMRQQEQHAEVLAGTAPDTLFLLEHTPVLTLGKNTGDGHVLASRELLAARGVEVFATNRGGDVTFHGPGQVVGYPIIKLGEGEQDIKRYVWHLEEILIRTVADFGITATRVDGLRGIWVGNAKIGAIGVRIARWVTMHGFALNVACDLDYFRLIVPCGLAGKEVTSIALLSGGKAPSLPTVMNRLAMHAGDVLERELQESVATPPPAGDEQVMSP